METPAVPAVPAVPDAAEADILDPTERAQTRLKRLASSFADILEVIADMYRDEDWRYLRKPDGSSYSGLPELVASALGESQAMARRRVQGVRELYLPLRNITLDDTTIQINSDDVAILGIDGARTVVEAARSALESADSPETQQTALRELIDTTKSEKRSRTAEADEESTNGSGGDGGAWMSETPDSELPPATDSGPSRRPNNKNRDTDDWDGGADTPTGEPGPRTPPDLTSRNVLPDLLDAAIADADSYETEAARAALPEPLRTYRSAIDMLLRLDPADVSSAITHDNRGVLIDSKDAAQILTRIRAQVKADANWIRATGG